MIKVHEFIILTCQSNSNVEVVDVINRVTYPTIEGCGDVVYHIRVQSEEFPRIGHIAELTVALRPMREAWNAASGTTDKRQRIYIHTLLERLGEPVDTLERLVSERLAEMDTFEDAGLTRPLAKAISRGSRPWSVHKKSELVGSAQGPRRSKSVNARFVPEVQILETNGQHHSN